VNTESEVSPQLIGKPIKIVVTKALPNGDKLAVYYGVLTNYELNYGTSHSGVDGKIEGVILYLQGRTEPIIALDTNLHYTIDRIDGQTV
jgi:hypothetical protein